MNHLNYEFDASEGDVAEVTPDRAGECPSNWTPSPPYRSAPRQPAAGRSLKEPASSPECLPGSANVHRSAG